MDTPAHTSTRNAREYTRGCTPMDTHQRTSMDTRVVIICKRMDIYKRVILDELHRSYCIRSRGTVDITKWIDDGVQVVDAYTTVPSAKIIVACGTAAYDTIGDDVGDATVLRVGHPSPRNTMNPFIGSNIFIRINEVLSPELPIRWLRALDGPVYTR